MKKEEFMSYIHYLCWVSYQMGCEQNTSEYNNEMKEKLINSAKAFLKNPNMTAEENHINWMKCLFNMGWKYGKFKDNMLKIHPDLISFNKLNNVEKIRILWIFLQILMQRNYGMS